jgi:hypothetical protein
MPTGFFKRTGHLNGRVRLVEKMRPFLQHLPAVKKIFSDTLSQWGKMPGDDIILMVVNEGELDLLLNFACSSRGHNIPLDNLLIVGASKGIVAVAETIG